ncbi:MAG: SH3 domain-containing protein [Caldilineaceae bacterium]|nr:SH3 domain-containing protein [Caldilineaceae bacterium]
MKERIWQHGAALLLAALLLAGCGRGGNEPTPTPTKTPDSAQTGSSQEPQVAGATTPAPATAAQATPTPPAATPTPSEKTVAVIDTDVLNVRRTPSPDGELVQTVDSGQQFDVIGRSQDGGWIQIGQGGRELGWVSAEFVTLQTVAIGAGDVAEAPAGDGVEAGGAAAQPTAQPPAAGGGNYLPAAMRSPDFGAQAFLWWRPEIADRDLTLMKEANFDWVKQAFAWETIEGSGKGQFDWSISDRVVTHVNGAGLKLLARLSSDPELTNFWAGHPPANADNFADFAFAVASRYNCTPQAVGCIQAYQIWNEPNLAREWGNNRPNPAQYAEFLGKAYAAIKRGNPNAIVISAGMAPTGDNNDVAMPDDIFYDGMYQAMGGSSDGYFDMLGVHGAGFAAPPELDPAEAASNQAYGGYRFFAFRHVEDIRAIMERYGDTGKKIVLLEFGWTYDPINAAYKWHGADAGITDMVQADYLRRAYEYAAANWQPWIGLMSLLTMPNLDWVEDGNPQDEEQYWWAILEPSQIDELKLRPAYVVLCIYFNTVKGEKCKYDPNG